ncbi:MAG: hypothetical protein V4678_02145 [Patescibacteria group bacterium]
MSETPSFNQITEQQASNTRATVLVQRSKQSGGEITVGTYAGESPDKPGMYRVEVMTEREGVLVPGYRDVAAEAISDSAQESLAERLAGNKLKVSIGHAATAQAVNSDFIDHVPGFARNQTDAVEVAQAAPERTLGDRIAEQSEKIDEMVADLSEQEVAKLYNFARYSGDKEVAQQSRDGEASALYGQYMGQELRSMSPATKAISSEFRDAMRHLQWLRDQQS